MSYRVIIQDPCFKHSDWPASRCPECTGHVPTFEVYTPVRSKGSKSAWNYTHQFTKKDRVQIKSRRHFERECSKRGLEHVVRDDLLHNGAPPKRAASAVTVQDKKAIEKTISEVLPKAKSLARQGAFK